jgi:nucleoside-diphosphate-sugar epimerase
MEGSDHIQMVPESDLDAIVDRAGRVLHELSERRILITGVSGFFGKWLLASLLYANRALGLHLRVTGVARGATRLLSAYPGLTAETCLTLTDADVTTWTGPSSPVDDVFHLATPASAALNRDQPQEMLRIISSGTSNVLERSRASGARRILLASSGAVYGKLAAGSPPVAESYRGAPDPMDVGTSYHQGKRLAEHLGALAARDGSVEVKVARCFAFAGPHLPLTAHFAFGNFLRDATQHGHIRVNGDGTAVRSYLYVADLMVWLLTILVRGEPSRPYNVGAEFAVSIEQLAARIAAGVGCGYSVARAPGSDPPDVYVPSTERARGELGLDEWTDLDGSIARTLNFLRARGAERCE